MADESLQTAMSTFYESGGVATGAPSGSRNAQEQDDMQEDDDDDDEAHLPGGFGHSERDALMGDAADDEDVKPATTAQPSAFGGGGNTLGGGAPPDPNAMNTASAAAPTKAKGPALRALPAKNRFGTIHGGSKDSDDDDDEKKKPTSWFAGGEKR